MNSHLLIDGWKSGLIESLVQSYDEMSIRSDIGTLSTTERMAERITGPLIWSSTNSGFCFLHADNKSDESNHDVIVKDADTNSGEILKKHRRIPNLSSLKRSSMSILYQELTKSDVNGHLLIKPFTFGESPGPHPLAASSQPFQIQVNPQVSFICDIHSHLCDAEVIGLLGGRWDPIKNIMHVQVAFPCTAIPRSEDDGSTDVELDPEADWQLRQSIEKLGMLVVGWYHSHPTFKPVPSVTDIFNQRMFQEAMQAEQPFVGLIISSYDTKLTTCEADHQWFSVSPFTPEGAKSVVYLPMLLTVEYMRISEVKAAYHATSEKEQSRNLLRIIDEMVVSEVVETDLPPLPVKLEVEEEEGDFLYDAAVDEVGVKKSVDRGKKRKLGSSIAAKSKGKKKPILADATTEEVSESKKKIKKPRGSRRGDASDQPEVLSDLSPKSTGKRSEQSKIKNIDDNQQQDSTVTISTVSSDGNDISRPRRGRKTVPRDSSLSHDVDNESGAVLFSSAAADVGEESALGMLRGHPDATEEELPDLELEVVGGPDHTMVNGRSSSPNTFESVRVPEQSVQAVSVHGAAVDTGPNHLNSSLVSRERRVCKPRVIYGEESDDRFEKKISSSSSSSFVSAPVLESQSVPSRNSQVRSAKSKPTDNITASEPAVVRVSLRAVERQSRQEQTLSAFRQLEVCTGENALSQQEYCQPVAAKAKRKYVKKNVQSLIDTDCGVNDEVCSQSSSRTKKKKKTKKKKTMKLLCEDKQQLTARRPRKSSAAALAESRVYRSIILSLQDVAHPSAVLARALLSHIHPAFRLVAVTVISMGLYYCRSARRAALLKKWTPICGPEMSVLDKIRGSATPWAELMGLIDTDLSTSSKRSSDEVVVTDTSVVVATRKSSILDSIVDFLRVCWEDYPKPKKIGVMSVCKHEYL